MRLRNQCLAFAFACTTLIGVAPNRAVAAAAASEFHSGGQRHQLIVDKDHVAVRAVATRARRRAAILSDKEAQAFAQIGVDIVRRDEVRAEDAIVGYPVWFDKKLSAVGVLTHEIVVRGDSPETVKLIRGMAGFADLEETHYRKGLYLAKFTSPMAALDAANELYRDQRILYAHPNFMIPKSFRGGRVATASRRSGPDGEPFFKNQWHLENSGQLGGQAGADIHAKDAWEVTEGDPSVILAVLDGGFELTHPDLEGAWYHNAGEIPGNGVDDDNNGYVDDVSGWNFWSKSNDPGNASIDDHGTAVAGLAGARRNGKGVTGVCPGCTLLPVVVSWTPADDAAAFYFAKASGAGVITNSWGYPIGTPTTDVVEEAITETATQGRDGKGTIILFAMNNVDQDDCKGSQPDISSLDAVVAVSGTSDLDKKVADTAWGDCMEILSPTYEVNRPGIATTDLTDIRGYNTGRSKTDLPDTSYTNDFSGTSAATPIAAGVFALMLSVNDSLTRDDALAIVLSTADKIQPALAHYDSRTGFSHKYGYGRINASRAVSAAHVFKKYSQRDGKRRNKG